METSVFIPWVPLRRRLRMLIVRTSVLLITNALLAGCSTRTTRFVITDHRAAGPTQRYSESFDEGYYAVDDHGNVDVVLRRESRAPDSPHESIVQVVHLRTVWKSVPGETVAHRSQINASVTYSIVTGRVGARFEGAGSLFFRLDTRRGMLHGVLESASLRPKGKKAGADDLFRDAEMEGEFTARHEPRWAYRILHETNREFE